VNPVVLLETGNTYDFTKFDDGCFDFLLRSLVVFATAFLIVVWDDVPAGGM
jgi:hypothetical protein